MRANLVSGLDNHMGLLGKRLDRVTGDKPARLHTVLLKQLEQTRHAYFAGKQTARNIVRRVFATVRPQPAADRVHVNSIGKLDVLCGHISSFFSASVSDSGVQDFIHDVLRQLMGTFFEVTVASGLRQTRGQSALDRLARPHIL